MSSLKSYLNGLPVNQVLTATHNQYVNHMGLFGATEDPEFVMVFVQGGCDVINISDMDKRLYGCFGMSFVPYWVARNVTVGIIDLTENFLKTGMPSRFRLTVDRYEMIKDLITSVKELYPTKSLVCMGHSFGGIEAARLLADTDNKIDKVIISNGSWLPSPVPTLMHKGGFIKDFSIENLNSDVLLVHHKQDQTAMCKYESIAPYLEHCDSITVDGIYPHLRDPGKEPGPHFYTGQEYEVVKQMYNWCIGKTHRRLID